MVRSHTIEPKGIINPCNEVEVRAYGFTRVFLFKIFYMVYLIECLNDKKVELKIKLNDDILEISIIDFEDRIEKYIFLSKKDVFDMVGILHHIQKQM